MKTSFVSELATRFSENPLLTPKDIECTSSSMTVVGLMNPAAFRFEKKTWLLIRVAQRPTQVAHSITIAANENLSFAKDDPKLSLLDPRVVRYDGKDYLTTQSHFKL